MKLNHINIKAGMLLLEKEKDFFCEILGLRDGFRPQFNHGGFWLYSDDSPIIHLSEDDSHGSEHKGVIDHLAFQSSGASDFVTTLKRLKIEHGINYIEETDALQVFLRSPLGIRIEVLFLGEKV